MFEFNMTEVFIIQINLIRFLIGLLLLVIGMGGKETALYEQPNTSTFVFLTGILLIGLSIN